MHEQKQKQDEEEQQQQQQQQREAEASDESEPEAEAEAESPMKGTPVRKEGTEADRLRTLWKQLRLQVRLDVEDTGAAYVLQVWCGYAR